MKNGIIFLIWALCVMPLYAEKTASGPVSDLTRILQSSLAHNPAIQLGKLSVQNAAANRLGAQGQTAPRLSLGSNYNYTRVPVPNSVQSGLAADIDLKQKWESDWEVDLSYQLSQSLDTSPFSNFNSTTNIGELQFAITIPITQSGLTGNQIRQSDMQYHMALLTQSRQVSETLLTVVLAYWQLFGARLALNAAVYHQKNVDTTLAETQELVLTNIRPQIDYQSVLSQLNQAIADRIQKETAFKIAQANLANLTKMPLDEIRQLAFVGTQLPSVPAQEDPTLKDALLSRSELHTNLQIEVYNLELAELKARQFALQAEIPITAQLATGYQSGTGGNDSMFSAISASPVGPNFLGQISMALDTTSQRYESAKLDQLSAIESAKQKYVSQKDQLKTDLSNTVDQLNSLITSLQYLNKAFAYYQTRTRYTRDELRLRTTTIENVLQVIEEENQLNLKIIQTQISYFMMLAKLRHVADQLVVPHSEGDYSVNVSSLF